MPWGIAAAAVVGAVSQNVASNKASRDINRANQQSMDATRFAAVEARRDVNELFPMARQSADLGFQGALDVFGQSVPSQANVFQQGNVGAQQQILAGLPQIQNAILGGNVDLSGLQPVSLQADLGFINQQVPTFDGSAQQQRQQQMLQPQIDRQQQLQQQLQQQQFITAKQNPLIGFDGIDPTGFPGGQVSRAGGILNKPLDAGSI